MDETLIERLARQCLSPLGVFKMSATLDAEVLDNVRDAIREAFLQGMAAGKKRAEGGKEVTHAGDHSGQKRGV